MGTQVALDDFEELEVTTLDGPIYTNQLLRVRQNTVMLTQLGYNEVRGHIASRYGVYIPDKEEWYKWLHTNGKYKGKLPKRIAKLVHEVTGRKLTPEEVSEIGNLARRHIQNDDILMDFSSKFKWEHGDFGDYGSCYWGCNRGAKDMISGADGFAVRFWTKYDGTYWKDSSAGKIKQENRYRKGDSIIYAQSTGYIKHYYEGKGRAWIIPHGDGYIMFNSYGIESRDSARILGTLFNMDYKTISLTNWGTQEGLLYINGYAWYFGDEDIKSVNLEIGDQDSAGHSCAECGDGMYEEDSYYIDSVGSICEYCYNNNYGYCENCGENYHQDSITWIDNVGSYCEHCRDNKFTYCDNCNEWRSTDSTVIVENDELCETCAMDNASCCETCCGWYYHENMENDEYCLECHEDIKESE